MVMNDITKEKLKSFLDKSASYREETKLDHEITTWLENILNKRYND